MVFATDARFKHPNFNTKRRNCSFNYSSFLLVLLSYKNLYQFFTSENGRKHQQGDGIKDEEEGKNLIKIRC